MHGLRTDIAVVHDPSFEPGAVVSALADHFSLRREILDDSFVAESPGAHLYAFCTSISSGPAFQRVKKALEKCSGEKLLVLPTHNSDAISRLRGLGIDDFLVLPIDPEELCALAKAAINRCIERSWATLHPTKQKALKKSLTCFQNCFTMVQNGEPLPIEEISISCQHIREAAELGGLDSWIEALDDHHNYSFRHSMFVCGSLTYFANAIGIGGAELDQLTVGGLLHDIGKSQVPLEVLDKPGKLDAGEWKIMKMHPEHSRTILLREQGLGRDTIAMAVHHHEKLDGTGYPDGLSGAEINDHVRLMAIADVYSALIDKRSYKEAMSHEAALDMMLKFEGHLDMGLLGAFRQFVLDEG
ncbi:MAG: HD domain-containing phosphohydrolase [Alphaproteobacteria bacterium]